MNEALDKLNKAFENKARLGIMSLLVVADRVDFLSLKKSLSLSDGNLASHLLTLEKQAYLKVHKSFVGRRPHTAYEVTQEGRQAFSEHLDALEEFLRQLDLPKDPEKE